jgi:hypothetical protein
VVCKVSDACIIKRRTGWKTIPAGPDRPHVELCGASAWAMHTDHLARVTDRGWQRVAGDPPWSGPDGFWANDDDDIWVAVAANDRIFHFDGRRWDSQPSPVPGPRSMWATGPGAVWLVGDGGAAHYDGTNWRRVDGLAGPLREVRGSSAEDVWTGGASGLWHGTRG